MIETKYGLKYPYPHSVVHIVDNSQYAGDLPTIIAEDPSLYSTIVVTGAPMGVDNKIVAVTRSDVLNTAFGMSSLNTIDREKYGQSVGYANSLIAQGAPVRFMRVTPEGSTYGFACILVQWRIDAIDGKCHVRFKMADIPLELALDKFKNTDKLNTELIRYFKNDNIENGEYVWKQRVLINAISAGRGQVYNKMVLAINATSQTKRPPNVRYEFATIDTSTNITVERFYASLTNRDNDNRFDAIESANVLVGRRAEGSSILVPYVNENAIADVYADYMDNYKSTIDSQVITDEFILKAYKALNVNTFDIIYGRYIYDGSELKTSLPYYQVDMYNSDIPALPATNRVNVLETEFDSNSPTILYDNLKPLMYGVSRNGDSVYVGDIYLNLTAANGTNSSISIVGTINQYSGAVTSLVIPKMYPLVLGDEGYELDTTTNTSGVPIAMIFNDATATDGTGSKLLNSMVSRGTIVAGNIVALTSGNTFKLFTVISVTPTAQTGDKYTLSPAYTTKQLYNAIAWKSHSSGTIGVGNIIGRTIEDAAYTRIGATVIDENGDVWVNDYNYTYDETDPNKGRIPVKNISAKFGAVPSDVNITTTIINAQYDILAYSEESAIKWSVKSVTIKNGGSDYVVGEKVMVKLSDDETLNVVLTVEEVDPATSAVTKLSVSSTDETVKPIGFNLGTINVDESIGTGLSVSIEKDDTTITGYEGNPTHITRYIVTGVQGSLFRVAKDPTVIPSNYYSDEYGISLTSENGGVKVRYGSTGFFDADINSIEFKWRYSSLLTKAYRGLLDPRIMSPTRCPAKYLFDGGHNTIVGTTILPYVTYTPTEIINASIIFTDDEKEEVLFTPSVIENITEFEDIDVKQAMYDLMIYRCYQGIPEDKRPVGPGSGLSLHLDSGVTDGNTALLVNASFTNRFNNPNASWDIGGWVDTATGISYTFTKQIVDNLFAHCKRHTVNKPYTGSYTEIGKTRYTSFFPDIDTTDWDLRELYYESGGNAWIPDVYGSLQRKSQRTLLRGDDNDTENRTATSDLVQESNMRTLSQLVYLLQNKIDSYLLEYDDDGVLKTLSDEVTNMFSTWVGTYVDGLDITFTRDINIDGGEILICNCNVTFRGLILRVPIIVNVNRRDG